MKLTNTQLEELIKEELETVMSETEGSNKWSFIIPYKTYLLYQGLEDQQAEKVAEQTWNSLSSNPFPMDEVIKMIGEKNTESFNKAKAGITPTKKPSRPWPSGPSPMERSPHKSAQEE